MKCTPVLRSKKRLRLNSYFQAVRVTLTILHILQGVMCPHYAHRSATPLGTSLYKYIVWFSFGIRQTIKPILWLWHQSHAVSHGLEMAMKQMETRYLETKYRTYPQPGRLPPRYPKHTKARYLPQFVIINTELSIPFTAKPALAFRRFLWVVFFPR